jgi:hemolysin activation/secretion protein
MARWRLVATLVAALAACGLPILVAAQSVVPGELNNAARSGENFLRQQQEIQQQQQLDRERANQAPGGAALPESRPAPGAAPSEGECVEAKGLEIVGARLLSKKQIARLRGSVVGHCVGARELNALLRQITDLYVSKGYITTRAYVPPQNTQAGQLTIVVIEGKVERIEIQPRGSANAATAFPGMTGQVFNLRDAEQGIDQLNRLPSNNAKIDIRPGSTPGASVLQIENAAGRRISGALSVDDTGSNATGLWQGTASLNIDDPLRLNDGLLLSYTHNLDSPGQGPGMSRAVAASYSVPYGWWTGNLMYSETAYDSLVKGVTRNFDTSGKDRNETARFSRVAYRDQSRKLTLYADIARRDEQNFVAGQRINASSRVLTILDLAANLSMAWGQSLWTFDAGVSRGVHWLGALHDAADLPGNAPHAEFLKATAGVGVSRGFQLGDLRAQASSNVSAQWSNSVLFPSEQIAITGPFAVRGFRDVSLFGDRGVLWRNELGFPIPLPSPRGFPLMLRPFIGADAGKVWAHDGLPGGYLTSDTAGLGLNFGRLHAEVSWSGSAFRSINLAPDHYFFARFAASF